jgi:transposase
MFRKQKRSVQQELWIRSEDLPVPASNPFYQALDALLVKHDFDQKVRELFLPYYKSSGPGQPGVDPAVYAKMLLIGFFERIPSERGIEARCTDSIMLRHFLGIALTERVPDHSTLSVIRRRVPLSVFTQMFTLMHPVLAEMGLIRGKNIGMDTSAMQANASMRNLRNRMTGDKYRAYVTRLAKKEGIDIKDPDAVNRFDRTRKKKTSNEEWSNPYDPDAKIGPTKQGNIRMIYKPEHTVDMDTGALIDVQMLLGDMPDTEVLTERVCAAEKRAIDGLGIDTLPIETLTADKGYFAAEELPHLVQAGIMPNIPDRTAKRNLSRLTEATRTIVERVRRRVKSRKGKRLLRRRGMYIERSFRHILDDGSMRRTTLRGRENIEKRYLIAALGYNLSLMLFTMFGVGRPKEWAAKGPFSLRVWSLRRIQAHVRTVWEPFRHWFNFEWYSSRLFTSAVGEISFCSCE